jgi:hypothetical protein
MERDEPMSTPEGRVKDAIKRALLVVGAWWHMPVQQGYGTQCLDFRCYTKTGLPFEVEAKADGGRPTPRQVAYALHLLGLGVPVYLVTGQEGARGLAKRIRDSSVTLESWQRQCATLRKEWEEHEIRRSA